ncbi:MAG: glycine cleavage system protein GcvH [Desulfitobacteriaceae bacterium]|nr:glycine cleavage system protein GcvH [Desulfitobacteriaceae bacterium]
MEIEKGLKYTKEHEWIRVEGNKAYIGITDYAQRHLGDIVFVELPEVDDEFNAGDTLGTVESVKAVSDVYTQISGQVVEINEELLDNPGMMNKEPYESWLACIEFTDTSELDQLMDAEDYKKFCTEED